MATEEETAEEGGETGPRKLSDALAELWASQERSISRERHGDGELVRRDGIPNRASGCLLPDGSRTDALCLTGEQYLSDQDRVWNRPVTPDGPLRRRGRLWIEPGVALHFLDEAEADIPEATLSEAIPPDLERDMAMSARIPALVHGSELFARLLYAALCNTVWMHGATGQQWRISWRGAGSVVARLRGNGDYLDWYCGGEEATVDEQVLAELRALGWELLEAADPDLG